MEPNITLADFKQSAGTKLKLSDWLLIDQQRINAFADATNDHQFIHTDPERAASTPFGCTIAHGFLTLSLLSDLLAQSMLWPEGTEMVLNYGSDKVRFLQPVKVNSRIRARSEVSAVSQKRASQYLLRTSVVVEIENDKHPALIADILSLYVIKES